MEKLELTPHKLNDNRLNYNTEKSFFGQTEMEYIGFWVTRTGIQPINKKVEAIMNLMPTTSKKWMKYFIGLVNYCRDMWSRSSHLLQPFTEFTSYEVRLKWTDVEQKAFYDIKQAVAH